MTVALVLGARGFLGRHVVSAFRDARDFELIEADLPGAGGTGAERGASFVPLDLLADPGAVAMELARIRPDAIVNCAGRTQGDEAALHAANVEAVERLLAAIRGAALKPRLIHIGSAAEYGIVPDGVFVGEDTEPRPLGHYGATKLAGTRLVQAMRSRNELDGVVLRVFNAVGAGMPPDSLPGAAIARLRAAAASGSDVVTMGSLEAVRDFVDVRDIADAVVAACRVQTLPPALVNVGTGRPTTARALVEALARRIGYAGGIAETADGSARSGRVRWMVADVSTAWRALGWRATHDLESIAASLVAEPAPARLT